MTHYVCTGGCGAESQEPGACYFDDCLKYERPLTVCHCEDGQHREAIENPNVADSETAPHET